MPVADPIDPAGIGIVVFFLSLYFIPTWIAISRNAKSKIGIAVLNMVFGWILLVWVVVFIWACVSDNSRK